MTMTREAKATEQREMRPEADGYTTQTFHNPARRAGAKADRGHCRMTPSEYRTFWMNRGSKSAETARFAWNERTRYPRRTVRR